MLSLAYPWPVAPSSLLAMPFRCSQCAMPPFVTFCKFIWISVRASRTCKCATYWWCTLNQFSLSRDVGEVAARLQLQLAAAFTVSSVQHTLECCLSDAHLWHIQISELTQNRKCQACKHGLCSRPDTRVNLDWHYKFVSGLCIWSASFLWWWIICDRKEEKALIFLRREKTQGINSRA